MLLKLTTRMHVIDRYLLLQAADYRCIGPRLSDYEKGTHTDVVVVALHTRKGRSDVAVSEGERRVASLQLRGRILHPRGK